MAENLEQLYQQDIVGGDTWSLVLKRGQRLRLTDPSGVGNVSMLAFHQRHFAERYNMPDSLKGQHTAHLTAGNCLFSDMGRVLVSIVEDTVGWHDPFGAVSTAASELERFGDRSYQKFHNRRVRNTYDNLLIELGKHGLYERDWHAPVNWFSTIVVEDGGKFVFDASRRKAGQSVTLRAELDTLVVLSATPHPFDPVTEWKPSTITAELFAGAPADDPCRLHRPENGRAYALTDFAALAY
jgi:urea carboxylase-associated protein 2